jgi:hypothetical protein
MHRDGTFEYVLARDLCMTVADVRAMSSAEFMDWQDFYVAEATWRSVGR